MSAVKFLAKHIEEHLTVAQWEEIVNQAKEMEKNQIISAFEAGKEAMEIFHDEIPDDDEQIYLESGDDYYDEHFC